MEQNIIVSVCLITYNQKLFIKNAVDSAINQKTNFKYEIIIGDDFSSDGTRELLIEYQKKYSHLIKLILHPKKNEGLPGKLNFLSTIHAAKGKYIAMCEGDDYWTDEYKLQKQVDFLEANPDFVICFHKVLINKNQTLIDDYITKVPSEITGLQNLLVTNYIHSLSVVFRNHQITLPSWFLTAMPGDYPFWMMLSKDGGKIKYFDEVMGVYRVHPNGLWSMQDGNNKYAQKIAVTLMNCAREINSFDKRFLKWVIYSLAKSVYINGYQNITRRKYLSFMLWATKRIELTATEKFNVFTPTFRKTKKRAINKLKIVLSKKRFTG